MAIHWRFFYCSIGLFLSVQATGTTDELSTLQAIKSSFIDPLGILNDWRMPNGSIGTQDRTHCNWTGVWCGSSGFVEKIDLSNMNLSGIIPDTIQDLSRLTSINLSSNAFETKFPKSLLYLTSLKEIDLSTNNFEGPFPIGIGEVLSLRTLNASSNNFSGFIPEDIGKATLLESLDLSGNYFEGSIPVTFRNLHNLRYLGLSGNNLTGEIPSEIGKMSSLETVILGYNEFEGEIPPEFGNLVNLRYLDLAVGSLSGQIPAELGKLQQLTTLYLYMNNLSGFIPSEIGNISSLVFLDVSDNQISGKIPNSLGGLKNLQLLNLMCNQLNSTIPEQLGDLPNLEVLALWKNSLTGTLPINLGKNSPLQWLDVSSNSLSGEIPSSLCASGNLTKLILFNNSLSGPIPTELSKCASLVRVRAQHNLISGTIPTGFGSLPLLQRLELAYNNISGTVPQDFAFSTSLAFIDFSNNQLESSIPSTIFSLPKLQSFLASNNKLEGNIPDQFQDCPSLSVLDVSTNQFSGNIPNSIASCRRLVKLDLKNNRLIGEIPTAIATMPTLSILNLSNNSLSGRIPSNFGSSPALEYLNLSNNALTGPVPSTGILMNINPNDLVGNPGLCGGVLPPCADSLAHGLRTQKGMHIYHIVVGFAIGASVILCLSLAIFGGRCVYKRWYLYDSFFYDWFRKGVEEWPWRLVAFQRVTFTSSDIVPCITEQNIVGMGGTGIVYKAEVHRSNITVAVKKLWRSGSDLESGEELLKEVNLLGRLRHRNIVRLLGYLHNENDVMMVYEYMPNGNLGDALHGAEGAKLLVDWVSRYNIAVGVAQGLNYLHNDCHPPVIHRDIKSNNILLDSNLDARIADFGLARMMVHKNETVSMVAGSYGYIAPEYGYTLKVDEKSDVYSYGVVLLELITGRKPLDSAFGDCTDLVEWVKKTIRENRALEEALDSSIAGHYKHVQEEMLLVLRIALLCTAKLPKDRPSMRDVLTMLGEAKPRRKSVCYGNNNNEEKPIFSTSPGVDFL